MHFVYFYATNKIGEEEVGTSALQSSRVSLNTLTLSKASGTRERETQLREARLLWSGTSGG
jgi:hypothetical protein